MNKTDTIYIAGHRGMVGSACRRQLESQGYANLVFRTSRELDLTRQADVEAFFVETRPDHVILAAAKVGGILANATHPAEFIYTNLAIQTNILHAAYRQGVRSLVFLGSSCIYPKFCPQPIREEYLLTSDLETTNEAYAIAKIAGVKMCEHYNGQYGTKFWALMPTNLYGENDHFGLEGSHVLPAMIRKFHLARLAAAGDADAIRRDAERWGSIPPDVRESLTLDDTLEVQDPAAVAVRLWGSGTPRREMMHVDDLARACVHVLERGEELPPQLVNVGTGDDMTIAELADTVRRVVGFEGPIVWDDTKPDGTPRKVLDVSRLTAMGYTPSITLEDGVAGSYAWYLAQLEGK